MTKSITIAIADNLDREIGRTERRASIRLSIDADGVLNDIVRLREALDHVESKLRESGAIVDQTRVLTGLEARLALEAVEVLGQTLGYAKRDAERVRATMIECRAAICAMRDIRESAEEDEIERRARLFAQRQHAGAAALGIATPLPEPTELEPQLFTELGLDADDARHFHSLAAHAMREEWNRLNETREADMDAFRKELNG